MAIPATLKDTEAPASPAVQDGVWMENACVDNWKEDHGCVTGLEVCTTADTPGKTGDLIAYTDHARCSSTNLQYECTCAKTTNPESASLSLSSGRPLDVTSRVCAKASFVIIKTCSSFNK